ncbi:wobble nucleotide-excising tRNase [Bradyrhizobium sp. USDA 4501]
MLRSKEQQLATFKREQARSISQDIRPANRKYEAPQLTTDYANLDLGPTAKLNDEALAAHRELCRREEAMSALVALGYDRTSSDNVLSETLGLLQRTASLTIIAELEKHPEMLRWVQEGSNYHQHNGLETCLLCGGPLSDARKQALERAFDDGLEQFVEELETARAKLTSLASSLDFSSWISASLAAAVFCKSLLTLALANSTAFCFSRSANSSRSCSCFSKSPSRTCFRISA